MRAWSRTEDPVRSPRSRLAGAVNEVFLTAVPPLTLAVADLRLEVLGHRI
jgi:hypothetical protein